MDKFKIVPLTVFALVVAASSSFIATNSFADNSSMTIKDRDGVVRDKDSMIRDKDSLTIDKDKMVRDRDSMMKDKDSMSVTNSKNVMVGGAAMYPNKNIIENAVNSKDHTTLVAAVKAAGLVDTLSGKGPFTVFAPTNAAFSKLPAGTVDSLLKPENKTKLNNILTFHVISGKLSASDLMDKIKAGNGQTKIKTVEGEDLVFKLDNGKITVIDTKGSVANISIADVFQSNGVIHVIDAVLLPSK
jgi:uncharacterized surface protein with fasciclin (FAS1) repeats